MTNGRAILADARALHAVQLSLKVQRGDKPIPEVTLAAPEDKTWPLVTRGLFFEIDSRQYIAHTVGQALGMGAKHTIDVTGQIYRSLKSIIVGRISFPKSQAGRSPSPRACTTWPARASRSSSCSCRC